MNFDDFDEGEFFEGNEANYFSDDERGIMENKKEDNDDGNEKVLESVWEKSAKEEAAKQKRKSTGPRPKLTEQNLLDPEKGLSSLKKRFDDYKFSSTDGPYEKLNKVLNEMEYWAHNLHPPLNFADCLARIETMGKKRAIKRAINNLRLGLSVDEPDEAQKVHESDDDDNTQLKNNSEMMDVEVNEDPEEINWDDETGVQENNRSKIRPRIIDDDDEGEWDWDRIQNARNDNELPAWMASK